MLWAAKISVNGGVAMLSLPLSYLEILVGATASYLQGFPRRGCSVGAGGRISNGNNDPVQLSHTLRKEQIILPIMYRIAAQICCVLTNYHDTQMIFAKSADRVSAAAQVGVPYHELS